MSAESIEYFRSNNLGLPLERISVHQKDDYRYVLERRREESEVTDLLYLEGDISQKAVHQWKNEKVYSRFYDGDILMREAIEQDGRIAEEIVYAVEGRLIRRYGWIEGELEYVDTELEKGYVERRRYIRSEDGRLLQIQKELLTEDTKNESISVSGFQYLEDTENVRQWHIDQTGCVHFLYQSGERKKYEKYCKGALIRKTEDYTEGDRRILIEEDLSRNNKSRTEFDTAGNIDYRELREGDNLIEEFYAYESERLTSKTRVSKSGTESVLYFYDGQSGSIEKETHFDNDIIKKEVHYYPENIKKIVVFRQAQPVAELTYEGEELTERKSLIDAEER